MTKKVKKKNLNTNTTKIILTYDKSMNVICNHCLVDNAKGVITRPKS